MACIRSPRSTGKQQLDSPVTKSTSRPEKMPAPRTVLGPPATAWAPPPTCTHATAGRTKRFRLLPGQSCNPERSINNRTDCRPPGPAAPPP
ncbi:hypothetical protein MAPG_00138 [Magnaporthiopsis poae ATCC 64411]|uniref:Uncharacterized protein n=1 Tax=Magnaporthiopsis poae (strain ATCC 64411 / 73-15) TaxID=644358 RepID=A0A0C4DK75_MAGP6|nr:hypothetical protein MAPG_00138 [Magnaporthiopsis poae ATCC 64411]